MTFTCNPHATLVRVFLDAAAQYKNRNALLYKSLIDRQYYAYSWNTWARCVKEVALGLYSLGIRKGDHVAILSENRPEWTFADLGILGVGAVTVPIYATTPARDIAYILENADIRILFVSTKQQYEKISAAKKDIPYLKQIIVFDDFKHLTVNDVFSLAEIMRRGKMVNLNNKDLFGQLVDDSGPDDLATIIYTSGTTGPAKGVMLTHKNFIENYCGSRVYVPVNQDDRMLSFLPLSHIFERLAGYYFMIAQGATIAYAENMNTIAEDIIRVRPTVATAVPRFFEKIYSQIQEAMASSPQWKKRLMEWALTVGRRAVEIRLTGRKLSLKLTIAHKLAGLLVFKKLKEKLGGRIRFFISGGAPLAKELAEYFYAVGILIMEGYGLTETSPVIAVNAFDRFRFGSVGQVLPNVRVRIESDGEIVTSSDCVMKGYFRNDQGAAEVIRDGWFYTGDIGYLDQDGFLHITDRKKDIIVTSNGKNIAPQNIENLLRSDKCFNQVVVIGDKRNYLIALIVPKRDEILRYARSIGLGNMEFRELLRHEAVTQWIDVGLKEKMKDLPHYEQIKYFELLENELTIENGELTPTLKVKRRIIETKYADIIERLYCKGRQFNR